MKKYSAVIVVLVVLLTLVPFAWSDEKKPLRVFDSPPKAVKPDIPAEYNSLVKTFDEYWNAIKKGDFGKAYDLESKDFRKTTGLEKYRERFGKDVSLKSVRALNVKKLNEKEVMVIGSMILNVPATGTFQDSFKPLNDRWVTEDGLWRHVPQNQKSEK